MYKIFIYKIFTKVKKQEKAINTNKPKVGLGGFKG